MSVTARMSKLNINNSVVDSVLKPFKKEALRLLYTHDHPQTETAPETKVMRRHVIEGINAAAVKYFAEQLDKQTLVAAVAPLNIDHKARGNNPNSKVVLFKRFNEHLQATGLEGYLVEHATVSMLQSFCEAAGVSTSAEKKEKLIEELMDHVYSQGARIFFDSFSENTLRDVAFELRLDEAEQLNTVAKGTLVTAIINNEEIAHNKATRDAPKFSKSKKPIKQGIAYQDIFQHYSRTEIYDWCKENNLKCSGTVKELINRILAFLDGDKENTVAKPPGERKRTARRKSTSGAKKTKKTRTPQQKPKVQEPEPEEDEEEEEEEEEVEETAIEAPAAPAPQEEEEEEEEEEGNDDDLELDNLDQYDIKVLKDYCKEEGIQVSGRKKADYIKAIEEYNSDV